LFGRPIDEIRGALEASGLDDVAVKNSGFDMSLARLDVKLAPEGIDKREIAKGLFEEFGAECPEFAGYWTGAVEEPEVEEDEDEDDYEDDDDFEDDDALEDEDDDVEETA
jgi:hypothetical protein